MYGGPPEDAESCVTSVVNAVRPYDDSVSDWMLDLTKSLTVTQLEELARADTNFQLKVLFLLLSYWFFISSFLLVLYFFFPIGPLFSLSLSLSCAIPPKTLGADFVMEYTDYGVFFQHEHQKPQDIVGVSGALALAMADWMQAFALCARRSITHRVRNPSVVCLSYIVCVAISAVLGALFYDLGFLDPVDGRCVS